MDSRFNVCGVLTSWSDRLGPRKRREVPGLLIVDPQTVRAARVRRRRAINPGVGTAAEQMTRPTCAWHAALESLVEDLLGLGVGATLLHVGEVPLGFCSTSAAGVGSRSHDWRAYYNAGSPTYPDAGCPTANIGAVSRPCAQTKLMRSRGAASPRRASPIGPAPTRPPRMALPPATPRLLGTAIGRDCVRPAIVREMPR